MSEQRKISLAELSRDLPGIQVCGDPSTLIAGITYDSRKVQPGDLFVAVPGTRDNGARFIPAALAAGAAAVLIPSGENLPPAPALVAEDVRLAMGSLAARFYGHPDKDITIIGLTGTNGKTTTAYLLEAILQAAGLRPGVLGTINYRLGAHTWSAPTTTPESADLFALLCEMRKKGCTHAVMEVSSHALAQKRVAGLTVQMAAFTNLSRDHLDYHPTLEDYYQAKKKLFSSVLAGEWTFDHKPPGPGRGAINLDHPAGVRLWEELSSSRLELLGYGLEARQAAVRAEQPRFSNQGLSALLLTPGGKIRITSRLLGRHNLENILAAATVAFLLGLSLEQTAEGIESLRCVPGRLEPVPNDAGLTILVDYAHTPDALAHALQTCREFAPGRLIVVFGCGGDRDVGKRPEMGKIAGQSADLVVITSDNPRTEDPDRIIAQIVEGMRESGAPPWEESTGRGWLVEPDRAKAIRRAVFLARAGDILLIAGKGHEDYQILGTAKIHFDDREEAAAAVRELKR